MADEKVPLFTFSAAIRLQRESLPSGAREWLDILALCLLVAAMGLAPVVLVRWL